MFRYILNLLIKTIRIDKISSLFLFRGEKKVGEILKKGLTFGRHKYIINYEGQKKEDDKVSPRIGRPTDNPKNNKITVRLDDEATNILEAYCEQEKIEKGEATRRGIKKLKSELKK